MKLNENTLKLAEKITQAIGVSGNEKHISRMLQEQYKKYTDDIIFDNLGSVYAVKKSKKKDAKRVIISANMDEAGFMVNGITENGLLKILSLGTTLNQAILAQRVRVISSEGKEFVGSLLSKISEEDKSKVVKVEKMLVDIGCKTKEEVNEIGVRLGDSIVIDGKFEVLANEERILSKAWNNRYGCILGIEILEAVKDIDLDVDLYVGCTVQKEIGLRGAETATNLIKPDLGIVLDCLEANDIDGKKDSVGKLGDGILVNYYDKSMMPNRALLNYLVETCKSNNIKHQYYYSMKENDAKWIHKMLIGCPTLMACICSRNTNTNSSIIDTNDYLSAKEAVISIIKSLNTEKVEAFKAENR